MLGYPILSVRSLPRDMDSLKRYFRDEVLPGLQAQVFDTLYDPEGFLGGALSVTSSALMMGIHVRRYGSAISTKRASAFRKTLKRLSIGTIAPPIAASPTRNSFSASRMIWAEARRRISSWPTPGRIRRLRGRAGV